MIIWVENCNGVPVQVDKDAWEKRLSELRKRRFPSRAKKEIRKSVKRNEKRAKRV